MMKNSNQYKTDMTQLIVSAAHSVKEKGGYVRGSYCSGNSGLLKKKARARAVLSLKYGQNVLS